MTTDTLRDYSVITAPPEIVSPLKPSEALRLGRLTRPRRIIGTLLNGDDGACAVGAIMTGYGIDHSDQSGWDAWMTVLRRLPAACPLGCPSARTYGIAHLNDLHGWTDDQIVAWLAYLGLALIGGGT